MQLSISRHFRYLIAFKNLLKSIESLGISSVYGINYFGRGTLVGDNYVSYVRHDILGRDLLSGSLTYVPSLKHFYAELTNSMSDYGRIKSRYATTILRKLFKRAKKKREREERGFLSLGKLSTCRTARKDFQNISVTSIIE